MTRQGLSWFGLQKHNGKIIRALLATFVVFYLVSHALSGERGIYVLLKEQHRLENLRAELQQVSSKRQTLDHKVQMMGKSSLDLDLLDEQARRYLSTAGEGEIMIPLNAPKNPQ